MKSLQSHGIHFLRNVSQTFFFNNSAFGASILLLFLCFSPKHFLCGLIAALIGYLYTTQVSTPRLLREWGLITINGFFFGIALATLFNLSLVFFGYLIFGALCIPFLTKAFFEILQHWKLSPFVIPYIFMIWGISLCAQGTELQTNSLAGLASDPLSAYLNLSSGWPAAVLQFTVCVFQSMGRLLFLPNSLFGFGIFLLVTLFGPRQGLFFLFGTVMANTAALFISAGTQTWEFGQLSYSAGLVGLGLAAFLEQYRLRSILLFCVLSTFFTLALAQFFKGLQLPILSLPYVFTLWIAMLSRTPRLNLSWEASAPQRGSKFEFIPTDPKSHSPRAPVVVPNSVYFMLIGIIIMHLWNPNALGQENRLSLVTDLTYASKYMTDGFKVGGDNPVVQPSVSLNWGATGLSLMFWTALQINRAFESTFESNDELDFFVLYSHDFFSGNRFAVNLHSFYDYWLYPKNTMGEDLFGKPLELPTKKGNKLHVGISFPELFPLLQSHLVPSYNVYYWLFWAGNLRDQYQGGARHEFLLQYFRSIHSFIPGTSAPYLGLAASLNYNDGAFGIPSGISHSIAQFFTGLTAWGCGITASLNRQWSYQKAVDPVDELWSTVSLTKRF